MLIVGAVLAALCGCDRGPPQESFAASSCSFKDNGEWRTRTTRGACIARSPRHTDINGHNAFGNCIAWASDLVHEKGQQVSCTKQRWVRR